MPPLLPRFLESYEERAQHAKALAQASCQEHRPRDDCSRSSRVADRRELLCDCGTSFTINARTLRRARSEDRTPVCFDCRPVGGGRRAARPRGRGPGAPTADELQRWWIEDSGLGLDELLEIAACLWGGGPAVRLSDAA